MAVNRTDMLQLTGFQDIGRGRYVFAILFGFPVAVTARWWGLTLYFFLDVRDETREVGWELPGVGWRLKDTDGLKGKVRTSTPVKGHAAIFPIDTADLAVSIKFRREEPKALYRRVLQALENAFQEEGITPPELCIFCNQGRCDAILLRRKRLHMIHRTCIQQERTRALTHFFDDEVVPLEKLRGTD
ncbi:MAG: hypothetical protein FWD84_02875 [Oscillospiraceae bacterium]|nr:hypothetical protein [Oscillospiraceae bacterium]